MILKWLLQNYYIILEVHLEKKSNDSQDLICPQVQCYLKCGSAQESVVLLTSNKSAQPCFEGNGLPSSTLIPLIRKLGEGRWLFTTVRSMYFCEQWVQRPVCFGVHSCPVVGHPSSISYLKNHWVLWVRSLVWYLAVATWWLVITGIPQGYCRLSSRPQQWKFPSINQVTCIFWFLSADKNCLQCTAVY